MAQANMPVAASRPDRASGTSGPPPAAERDLAAVARRDLVSTAELERGLVLAARVRRVDVEHGGHELVTLAEATEVDDRHIDALRRVAMIDGVHVRRGSPDRGHHGSPSTGRG